MFGFLTVDFERKEARIFQIKLKDPFIGHSFNDRAKWEAKSTLLDEEAFEYLKGCRNKRPNHSIFSASKDEGSFVVL